MRGRRRCVRVIDDARGCSDVPDAKAAHKARSGGEGIRSDERDVGEGGGSDDGTSISIAGSKEDGGDEGIERALEGARTSRTTAARWWGSEKGKKWARKRKHRDRRTHEERSPTWKLT
jgi:hypothetical protein